MLSFVGAILVAILGTAGVVLAAVVGLVGGVYLERVRSREWARKERWLFKRSLYEAAFEQMGVTKLAYARWLKDAKLGQQATEEIRALTRQFGRIEAFCGDDASRAVEKLYERLRTIRALPEKPTDEEHIRLTIDVLRELEEALQHEASRDFDAL